MKIERKYIIASAIGIVTIAGALAYLQYKKLMNYTLKFKGLKIRKLSFTDFDFDIILDFVNKSKINFIIERQEYDVYVNKTFVSKLKNDRPTQINALSSSPLVLSVKVNPKDVLQKLGLNAVNLTLNAGKTIIKVDAKLKVKLWFFTINIPFVYEMPLKDMITKQEPV